MSQRSKTGRSEQSTLSIGPMMAAPDVLERLGADVEQVLQEAGFKRKQFEDPDNLISYDAMGRLFARGVAHTRCEHLGLLVGKQGGLHSLGLVGLLVNCSKDVETALRGLERHFHLRVRGAALVIDIEGDAARIGHVIHSRVDATDQINDGALAELFNILRTLCGPTWQPTEVQFSRRVPGDVRPYRRFFGAPLRFDADLHAVVFSASWLSLRLPATDPILRSLLTQEIERLEHRHGGDFPDQVRSVVRSSLATGQVSAEHIAALFLMHSRTLARRLEAFGTGLRELLDETRLETARQMLEDTSLNIGQIAASLGYARASIFIRSFRRWTGTTPATWRRTHGSAR